MEVCVTFYRVVQHLYSCVASYFYNVSVDGLFIRMIALRNNFITGLIYLILSQVGLLFNMPPSSAAVFWPAAGFALFAVLHMGIKIWPGLLLGAFLYKYINFVDERFLIDGDYLPILGIILISFAPVLQAIVGGIAVKKMVGYPSALDKQREIILLLFIGGIVCSLIAPTLGVGTLYVFGEIALENIFSTFTFWWVGDILGIIVVLPVLILLFMPRKDASQGRKVSIISSIMVTMAIILILFSYFKYAYEQQKKQEFYDQALIFKTDVQKKIENYYHVLNTMADYFEASIFVERKGFKKFTKHFLAKYPQISSISWAPHATREEVPGFQEEAQANNYDFYLKHLEKDGTIAALLEEKMFYFPIYYVEPFASMKSILGLDLGFDEKHTQTLNYAAETGNLAVSKMAWKLEKDKPRNTGYMMVEPVYYQGSEGLKGKALSDNLLGYMALSFNIESLLADVKADLLERGMVMHFTDISEEGVTYGVHVTGYSKSKYFFKEDKNIKKMTGLIKLANRTWEVNIFQLKSKINRDAPVLILITLVGGSAFLILLLILLFTITGIANETRREIKRRTKELQEAKNRFDLAVAGANDGIWDWNIETDEMYYAPHYRELLGYKGDDLAGFPNVYGSFYSHLHEDDRARVGIALQEHIEEEKPFSLEYRLRHITGEYRDFHARGAVIRNQHGRAVRMAGSITDVTQRIRTQREIELARREADFAIKVKEDFLASVSHEIRTPLNGIIGTADLLASSQLKGEELRCVETIQTSGRILLALLNDVLDYSKIEAGKLSLNEEPLSLLKMLNELFLLFAAMAKKHNLSLKMDISKEVPKFVNCDEVKMRQVLHNLISNAIKFTDYGSITLKVDVVSKDIVSTKLCFSVIDTGVGIPINAQQDIFDNFTQLQIGGKEIKGTGLGLAICKSIVEMMGGEIGVESKNGDGATFWFTVNLDTIEEDEVEDDEFSDVVLEKVNAKILVVEDIAANIFVIERMLKKLKINVDIAEDGLSAVQAAEKKKYDLIFMDCNLPKLSGYGATRRIRNKLKRDDLPIIALTANAMQGDKRKCLNAGMNDFLPKPIKMRLIHKILAKWLPDKVEILEKNGTENKGVKDISLKKEKAFLIKVYKEFGDQSEKFIELSLKDADKFIDDLVLAHAKGDAEELQFAAHALKGVFKGVYIESLVEQARTIELIAKGDNLNFDEIVILIKKIQMDYSNIKSLIQTANS